MNQFCCHPQHGVQCVLQHPRNKEKRTHERKVGSRSKESESHRELPRSRSVIHERQLGPITLNSHGMVHLSS